MAGPDFQKNMNDTASSYEGIHCEATHSEFDSVLERLSAIAGFPVSRSFGSLLLEDPSADCEILGHSLPVKISRTFGTESPALVATPWFGADLGPMETCWAWYDGPIAGSCMDPWTGEPSLYADLGSCHMEYPAPGFGAGAKVVSGATVYSLQKISLQSIEAAISSGSLPIDNEALSFHIERWCGIRLGDLSWDKLLYVNETRRDVPLDGDLAKTLGCFDVAGFPDQFGAILAEFSRMELESAAGGSQAPKTPAV